MTKACAHFSALVGFSTRACAGISGFRNRRGSAGASGACGSYSGSPASQYQRVISYSPAAMASTIVPTRVLHCGAVCRSVMPRR